MMATLHPTKKRAIGSSATPLVLLSDVHTLDASVYKAELEHERSLRALDAKKAKHNQEHLERQVQFAVEEAEMAKAMLTEVKQKSDAHVQKLRDSRDETLRQLRELQVNRSGYQGAESSDDDEASGLWKRKYSLLQAESEGRKEEVEALKERLEELKQQLQNSQTSSERKGERDSQDPFLPGDISAAPEAVLKELNRVRIQMAESERKQRQLRRALEDSQKKAKALIAEREAARTAAARVQRLEMDMKNLRQRYESAKAENQEWKQFGKTLASQLGKSRDGLFDFPSEESKAGTDHPPEIAMLVRFFDNSINRCKELEQAVASSHAHSDKMKEMLTETQSDLKNWQQKEESWSQEKESLLRQHEIANREKETILAQEKIWKREADSLRSLIKTFDELPLSSAGQVSAASHSAVEATLSTTRDELLLLKQHREKVAEKLDTCIQERETQRKELERVKERFLKLRDALMEEKKKVEHAELRANTAEDLAGKGSFNPEKTRILHLQQNNPMISTLKDEIKKLKNQLATADESVAIKQVASAKDVDPDKLHRRLKESFKEQIGVFREGVYLMTGYKIDMLPGGSRPMFRVRSMYAEKEEDNFLLKWPKQDAAGEITSLDIMATEFANVMSTTPSYDYMTKFNSLPAFLASVQLSLFEKQTLMC